MRLIDANAVLKGKNDHEMISTHIIWNAPTIDAEPVRHGHWIDVGSNDDLWRCSVCGELQICYGRYCSTCGAKMDEVEDENS